jgi:hypothetical protein
MSGTRTTPTRPTPWRRTLRLVLAAVVTALAVTATPGVASAAGGTVTPLMDCYTREKDGSYTLVFGYSSTNSGTKTISRGYYNQLSPAKYQGSQPTSFAAGTTHAAFTLRATLQDTYQGYWYLDGHTLTFYNAMRDADTCAASTPLPASGNGTGIAIGLVVAGVAGTLIVRRLVRRGQGEPAGTPEALDA